MSKRKNSNSGFIVRLVAVVVALCIVAAGVCCVGFAARDDSGKWFSNTDLLSWHWKDKTTDEEKPDDNKQNNQANGYLGGLVIDEEEIFGEQMTLKATPVALTDDEITAAESAYSLRAALTPIYTTQKAVDWSASFVNPSSTWATGKNIEDHLTVVPSSDGSLNAKVYCLQPFGEPIRINVNVRENPDITVGVIADYEQKLTNVSLHLYGGKVDKTTLVGTWQLCDPTSSGFQYATTLLGSTSWSSISMTYATSTDYAEHGFRYKHLMPKTGNSVLSGLWFAYSSSPEWSITFSEMTESYKDFYLYIQDVDTSSSQAQQYSNQLLNAFNQGLFTKVSDNCEINNTDKTVVTDTLVGGQTYSFGTYLNYTDGTIVRPVSYMTSICDFGLVNDFCTIIDIETSRAPYFSPATYEPNAAGLIMQAYEFDLNRFCKMLNMSDGYYTDNTHSEVNDVGKQIFAEHCYPNMQAQETRVNLGYILLKLVDNNDNVLFEEKYYFAIDIGTISVPAEDITIPDVNGSIIF